MSDRIAAKFDQARQKGRPLFIAYLCAGDPDWETSLQACRVLVEEGIDMIELGVPFSDPMADGLTNQLAAQRALESGMTAEKVLALARAIRGFSDIPLVIYTYYNLVNAQGEEAYVRSAREAGIDGILTLDLPPEEAASMSGVCRELDMKTIFIVAPTTPPERVSLISREATGFLYYVSRTGVTGERPDLAADLTEKVLRIRENTDMPVVVGFGISNPEQVRMVGQVADGVVVGSALVNCLAANTKEPEKALEALRAKARYLVGGLSENKERG